MKISIIDLIRESLDEDKLTEAIESAILDSIDYDELASEILDNWDVTLLILNEASELISPF